MDISPNRGITANRNGWFVSVRGKHCWFSWRKYGKKQALLLAQARRDEWEAGNPLIVGSGNPHWHRPIGFRDPRSILPDVGVKPIWYKYRFKKTGRGPYNKSLIMLNGTLVRGFRATWTTAHHPGKMMYKDFLFKQFPNALVAYNAALAHRKLMVVAASSGG